ncbi:MAG: hypothetical protein V2A73_21685, partial [Pseudomonadota bacterium]
MAELATGKHPYHGLAGLVLRERVVDAEPVPLTPFSVGAAELMGLVRGCLDKDPEKRPSAVAVVRLLEDALAQGGRQRLRAEESPFRGLFSFGERNSDLFFGRDVEVAAFLERLREQPVLAVVGPSGSGKSSFVQAGVVPRLREQGSWEVLVVRPGSDPFGALAARLEGGESGRSASSTDAKEEASNLRHQFADLVARKMTLTEVLQRLDGGVAPRLRDSPQQLNVMLGELAERTNSRVLLLVDQIEETYTLVSSEQQRSRFLQAVCGAADDPHGPVRVVFTVRDDFLGRLAESGEIEAALRQVTVLRRPGPEALRDILCKPIEALGYRYEDDGLVEEMIQSVREEPACLPLLQFAGQMLWERRDQDKRMIRRQAYEAMGRITGVLAEHADGVLASLPPAQLKDARDLLLRLVTPEGTRRVVAAAAVLDGLGCGAADVLSRLVQARLVTTRRGSKHGEGETVLELVHESLVRNWTRLARWLEESREDVTFVVEVGQAAELWEKRGRRHEEVWQGDALAEARRKMARLTTTVPEQVTLFLQAGLDKERRRRQRRRLFASGTMTFLVIVAVVSVWQERRALTQKVRAEQREAEALREGARAAFARGDLLEARAKLRGSLETSDSTMGRVLWGQLRQEPLVWSRRLGTAVSDVAYAPDGGTVAGACVDGRVYLVDAVTTSLRVLRGSAGELMAVAFSPDGRYLAAGSKAGPVLLWDIVQGSARELIGHDAQVFGAAFDSTSQLLASASFDTTVRLWDVASGREHLVLRAHRKPVTRLVWRSAGILFSASKDGTVRQWDTRTGASRVVVQAGGQIYGLTFDRATGELVTGGLDQTIRRWDSDTGEEREVLRGHRELVTATALGPDGRLLASSSLDRTVRLWDRESGRHTIVGKHRGIVSGVTISPDGRLVASSSHDDTLGLWHVQTRTGLVEESGHAGTVRALSFSPDGSVLVSGGEDKSVRIWDTDSGRQNALLAGHHDAVMGVAFNPDGKAVASASHDRGVRFWDLSSGMVEELLPRHGIQAWDVVISSDRKTIASVGSDWSVRLWDAQTFLSKGMLKGEAVLATIAISPDGTLVAAASESGIAYVWEKETSRLKARLSGHAGGIWGMAFTPDGESLVTGGIDGTVRIWSLASTTGRVFANYGSPVERLASSPDGGLLGIPTEAGLVFLADMANGEPRVVLRGHRGAVSVVRFAPDGRLAATSGFDGTVRTWDVATGRPYWRAPLMLRAPPRLFTHLGWIQVDGEHGTTGEKNSKNPTAASVLPTAWSRAVAEQARFAAEWAGAPATDSRTILLRGAHGNSLTGHDKRDVKVDNPANGNHAKNDGARRANGGFLCLLTYDDRLQFWNMATDRPLASEPMKSASQLAATRNGCLVLADGRALLLDYAAHSIATNENSQEAGFVSGAVRELSGSASVVSYQEGHI